MPLFKKAGARVALLATVSFAAGTAQAGGFALVWNADDSGPGSLRNALEVKQASRVVIPGFVGDIQISSTLEYSSTAPVSIIGSGQTIATTENVTLLAVTQGANLTVRNLHFEGPGGFSILNRGDLNGPAGKGIFVDVRDDQTGKVRVNLTNVSVEGVANHGIHISDCSLADDCGGGSGGGGEGSDASIEINCNNCRVFDAGNGKFDADGFRGDERGPGSIFATFRNSSFNYVGADGIEVDEGNDGDVFLTAIGTDFSNNGGYCDPAIVEPFIPEDAEFELEDGKTEEDVTPTGTPDDGCIETEFETFPGTEIVSEVEYGNDTDDGADGDEAGPGSLWVSMINTTINDNLDEGSDMDEEDEGDIVASYVRTSASGNADDGYKHSEEDAGGTFGNVRAASATSNGGKGFVFEEADDGDLAVNVRGTSTSDNDDSDKTGIEAVQEDEGTGVLRVRGSDIADGIDLDGVELL